MGDSEEKKEYTTEDLEEIDRILDLIPQDTMPLENKIKEPKPIENIESPAESSYEAEPELQDEESSELSEDSFEETLIPLEDKSDEQETEDVEELEDITDLIQEVEEPSTTIESLEEEAIEKDRLDEYAPISEDEPIKSFEEDLDTKTTEPFEIPEQPTTIDEIKDFDPTKLEEEEITPEEKELSPLEELEAITDIEPELTASQELPEVPDVTLSDIEAAEAVDSEILSDIDSVEEAEAVEEASIHEDISTETAEQPSIQENLDIDLETSGLSPIEELEAISRIEESEDQETKSRDTNGIQDIVDSEGLTSDKETAPIEDIADDMPAIDLPTEAEEFGEPSVKEEVTDTPKSEEIKPIEEIHHEESEEGIELSEKELKQLKKSILFLHPNLRKEVTEVVLNDLLPINDTRSLVDKVLSGKSDKDIQKFLESKLDKKIDISEEIEDRKRRIITARPEYTKEGRERQKRLLRITKIFGITSAIAFLITILSYQYIYKPIMAKRNIDEGVAIIRKPGEPISEKIKDYKEAEEIFEFVNKNYVGDYLYGYNSYARAYLNKKEYDFALEKLNKAYEIDKRDIDTLNNIGFFYSRVPERYFKRIKSKIHNFYYKEVSPLKPVESELDIAIDFYRKVLAIDPKNITALFGIGNAYSSQGQYLEAKNYYENIIKADPDSVVGHAGILNLYLDRDDLPNVLSTHSSIYYRKLLPEIPSALLGKLASYYLSKKRTDNNNIRIDYGIQSKQVKDINDNPYPAVRNVLNALRERDMNYPPLFLHSARLYRELKNFKLMERSLQSALKKEANYFGALHLMGEYHYMVKEPVQAYRYFNKALKASLSPPEFIYDDYYYETESIGKTYTMLGNIFYYFFDRVKYRFGDELEDKELDEEIEKIANYEIAREKYEKALEEGYTSSELYYNLGRIYYMRGQYEKATNIWLNLYEEFTSKPELMFAIGNASYHQNNFEASKGEYLRMISIFENKIGDIKKVPSERPELITSFQTLSSAYNNLGAVYQVQNNEAKSSISYWKAIDYAKRIGRENEFARVNLARAFKAGREGVLPIIDENIPFSIDIYREDMR